MHISSPLAPCISRCAAFQIQSRTQAKCAPVFVSGRKIGARTLLANNKGPAGPIRENLKLSSGARNDVLRKDNARNKLRA